MSSSADVVRAVSDPQSEDYDPQSPFYDVTADSSSVFYVGPIDETARSGDDIRAEVTSWVEQDPLAAALSAKEKDAEVQRRYTDAIEEARQGLDEGLELRPAGEAPRTVWDNASHEQMVEVLNSNADSVAIADTSEEWVRLGNELTLHQRAIADAIDDSMGDWIGEGGDAARRHLTEVAKWLGQTAQGAVLTGRQQQIHSQTLNESQKQMAANPPVRFSVQEANARLQQITDPVAYAQEAHQAIQTMQAQQAAREQAARIMTQFDDTIGAAINMPLFTPPPKLAGGSATTASARKSVSPAGGGAAGEGDMAVANGLVARSGADGAGGVPGSGADAAAAALRQAQNLPEGESFGAGADVGAGTGVPGVDPAAARLTGVDPSVGGGPAGSGIDPAATGQHVSVPDLPGTSGSGFRGQPLSATGEVPGGTSFDPTTHAANSASATPPSLRVPDLPTGGQAGGLGAGASGGGTPGLSGFSGTTASSYTPPDTKRPGAGKTPKLGWSGGVNGDSISSRLGGSSGLDGLSGTGGQGRGAGSVPKLGGGGGAVGGGVVGAGGIGDGQGATGSGRAASTPGQVSGAAKGMVGGEAAANAAQRAAGQGGRGMTPGMAGMPAAGGAKGKDDDKEHRAASYLEADDDLFAAEQAIAPPVIGDWKNNKDENWK